MVFFFFANTFFVLFFLGRYSYISTDGGVVLTHVTQRF